MSLLLLILLLIIIAAAAHYFLPHPIGQFVAFVCAAVVLILVLVLVLDVAGDAGARGGDVHLGDGH